MGKYLGDITELAKAAVKDFKGKKPSHKDMGNWLADKLGEPKNTYGSQDFVDTLDSVYNEYDFWNDDYEDDDSEIVNDKSLDAIKDNFTPPGAKGEKKRRIVATDNPNWKWDNEDIARRFMAIPLVGGTYENNDPETAKEYYKQLKKMPIEELVNERDLANTMRFEGEDEPEWAKEKDNEVLNPTYSSLFGSDAPYSNMESILDEWDKEDIDTNDNGKIEVDEMADFQKSLDDYAAKNKKGRDDIPVTTRR